MPARIFFTNLLKKMYFLNKLALELAAGLPFAPDFGVKGDFLNINRISSASLKDNEITEADPFQRPR